MSPSYPYLFSVFLGSALIFCIGFSGSATRSDNILKLFLDINLADQNQPRAEEDTAASSVQDMRQMLEARLYAGPVELLDFVRKGFRRLNKKSSSSEEEEKDGARPEIIQSDNFFITPSLESGTAQQIQYRYIPVLQYFCRSRAVVVDPHFFADPDPAVFFNADPDPALTDLYKITL